MNTHLDPCPSQDLSPQDVASSDETPTSFDHPVMLAPSGHMASDTGPTAQLEDRVKELEVIVEASNWRIRELELELELLRLRPAQSDHEHHTTAIYPSFATDPAVPDEEWQARTNARTKLLCFIRNRSGIVLCAWHASRRSQPRPTARMPPPGYLHCGCTYEETLFGESLARSGVGRHLPGEGLRMDSALCNPLLQLLQERYGYRDGDFERDPVTGNWIEGEGGEKWERMLADANPSRPPRRLRDYGS